MILNNSNITVHLQALNYLMHINKFNFLPEIMKQSNLTNVDTAGTTESIYVTDFSLLSGGGGEGAKLQCRWASETEHEVRKSETPKV